MDDIRERLLDEFRDKEARTEYADEFLDTSIALQIAALRQQRGLTQKELGESAGGMLQSRISTMETVDYSSWSVRTLRRLAKAFDLPLVIRFESWGNFLDEVTKLGRRDLERPTLEQDPVFQRADSRSAISSSDTADNVIAFPMPDSAVTTKEAAEYG